MKISEELDTIANEIFLPAYEIIAHNALRMLGRKSGSCLDIGCGGGHLGLSLARASNMHITLMDISEDTLKNANNRIENWGLSGRASTVVGDVHRIDLPGNSFDLIVSRGSIGFWGGCDEMKHAFLEIYKVLAPGGTTFIGNGFGNEEQSVKITEKMKVSHPEWLQFVKSASNGFGAMEYACFLDELEIDAGIINDKRGVWVIMKKPA